ncbi:hypothetical protein Glove_109g288 [Diversispora epigaea]|uniref:Uncharacterized protein n=1 Tax=Diversispora epigaea TaxID=1348612 RepID=A0A397J6V9_9GLOM|nr:hypothetical protein Glove_109g288 [Diversispora epigaea]
MSFSYKKPTDPKIHTHDFIKRYGFKLVMERLDIDIAKIYFLGENDEPLPKIPSKVKCVDIKTKIEKTPQEMNGIESFLITWQNDYRLRFDRIKFFTIINQKQQSVYPEGVNKTVTCHGPIDKFVLKNNNIIQNE